MALVAIGEVRHLNPIFGELGQPQETLFKLFCLIRALFHLLELLAIVNFIFKSPLHDFLSDLFDAVHEEGLQFVFLSRLIDMIGVSFFD